MAVRRCGSLSFFPKKKGATAAGPSRRSGGFLLPRPAQQRGLAVYDFMRLTKTPIRTVCVGIAASMAAILFLAGDRREMLPHSQLMIHDPAPRRRLSSGHEARRLPIA